MQDNGSARAPARVVRRYFYISLLVVVSIGITFVALLLPTYQRQSSLHLSLGEVAPQDLVASQALTYISDVRTQDQREAAARSVAPVYSAPDTSIARREMDRLRALLSYISSVRSDAYASQKQKETDLSELEDIQLAPETVLKILALNEQRWQVIQQEAIVVLEQVMRSTIREDNLDQALKGVPSLVSLSLPEEQAAIVSELVSGFVVPNSLYNETLTEAARQQARDSVQPVSHTYMLGESVVQRGQVLTEVDLEALEKLGLVQTSDRWRDFSGAAVLTLLVATFLLIYLSRNASLRQDLRSLSLVLALFIFFLVLGRWIVPGHTIIPYVFPLTAFCLAVNTLFGAEVALVFSLPLAVAYAYGLPNSLELTLYNLVGGFFGVLTLGPARRMASFFWSALAVAASGALVILAFRLPDPSYDWIGIASLSGASVFNGLASASLAILIQFFLAQFMGMTTALQLMELTRPDHPLLQFILRNAPGSYQHSLQVANLAEQAAEVIGADPLLTRVGALYHDAGKALNPFYFIENQINGTPNPHEELDPAVSAATIIRHVTAGIELAQKYRLPARVRAFIPEHHGTMLTRYQYIRAVNAAGGDESLVDKEKFRYPGPRPQSREAAILMLADGSEARVRAERPADEQALSMLIKNVIDNAISLGQLDDTDLTLRDLDKIRQSFMTTLRGVFHPRIEYPSLDSVAQAGSLPAWQAQTVPRPSIELPTHTETEL